MAFLTIYPIPKKKLFEVVDNHCTIQDISFKSTIIINLTQTPEHGSIQHSLSQFIKPNNILGCSDAFSTLNSCDK